MCKKYLNDAALLILVATLLAGCGLRASSVQLASATSSPTPLPLATSSPTPSQPEAADACGDRVEITIAKVVGTPAPLQPANILFQLAWMGGFAITRPESALAGGWPMQYGRAG